MCDLCFDLLFWVDFVYFYNICNDKEIKVGVLSWIFMIFVEWNVKVIICIGNW